MNPTPHLHATLLLNQWFEHGSAREHKLCGTKERHGWSDCRCLVPLPESLGKDNYLSKTHSAANHLELLLQEVLLQLLQLSMCKRVFIRLVIFSSIGQQVHGACAVPAALLAICSCFALRRCTYRQRGAFQLLMQQTRSLSESHRKLNQPNALVQHQSHSNSSCICQDSICI